MSIEAMSVVLHHSKAHGTTKLVALGIANHYGDAGAYPSRATLAKYANCSDRQVTRAIQELLDLGEITCDPQAGSYGTNVYTVTVRCPDLCDGTINHRKRVTEDPTPRHPRLPPLDTSVQPPWTYMSNKPEKNLKLTFSKNDEKELARIDREQRLAQHKKLSEEMAEAKAKAEPMPNCKHNKPLLQCIPCCKELESEQA